MTVTEGDMPFKATWRSAEVLYEAAYADTSQCEPLSVCLHHAEKRVMNTFFSGTASLRHVNSCSSHPRTAWLVHKQQAPQLLLLDLPFMMFIISAAPFKIAMAPTY